MNDLNIYKAILKPSSCAADLGDGSERGEYVNQDYILQKLGRPHRAVSIMFCYYPYDKGWPERASIAYADNKNASFWDYPYDDYFTYTGGPGKDKKGEPFNYMRDIRRHGQDIILTLTIDPNVSDEHLICIARELSTFGRMYLRINHEATGCWFSFNKRCTYSQVADFFVRFHRIIKEYAPNVSTVLCIDGLPDVSSQKIDREEEFTEAVRCCDIWSTDKYVSLNWGWPAEIAEPGSKAFSSQNENSTYDLIKKTYERFCKINFNKSKKMLISEFNADGNVCGPYGQAECIEKFYSLILDERPQWLSGICFYQFRDRGRLGLELQSPSNPDVGIEQPVLESYRKLINSDWFCPEIEKGPELSLPVTLRWGGSEDAEGISFNVELLRPPVFCELYFNDDGNYMIQFNNMWFYKAPHATFVDLMPSFRYSPFTEHCSLSVNIFAPPSSGENDLLAEKGLYNTYTDISSLPRVRIYYDKIG
ncbi:MAG: hypothetical protein Q4F95_09185 [Oscillospiraceae bacterium]|nr:hypothetical protein [Oscillospiraceae bacterium]